jgi:hypothetical protein
VVSAARPPFSAVLLALIPPCSPASSHRPADACAQILRFGAVVAGSTALPVADRTWWHRMELTSSGGYREQLDRVRRLLERIEGRHRSDVEFKDIVWSFFQHCWHLIDWLQHDGLVSETQKQSVKAKVHASALLVMCRDVCNGVRHAPLKPLSPGTAARCPDGRMDCLIHDGFGNLISGKKLARDCLAEWLRILESQGLPTARLT